MFTVSKDEENLSPSSGAHLGCTREWTVAGVPVRFAIMWRNYLEAFSSMASFTFLSTCCGEELRGGGEEWSCLKCEQANEFKGKRSFYDLRWAFKAPLAVDTGKEEEFVLSLAQVLESQGMDVLAAALKASEILTEAHTIIEASHQPFMDAGYSRVLEQK